VIVGLIDNVERAYALLEKRSIKDFEVYGLCSDGIRAESKHGEVDFLNRASESGISIRVIMDGAIGFSYGKDADDALIDAAITSARYQFKDNHNQLPSLISGYPHVNAFDQNIASLSPDDCIMRSIQMEQSARDADPRVENIRKASFSRTFSQIEILNSHGIHASFSVTSIAASLMVTVRQDSDVQSGYDFDFSHALSGFDVVNVGRSAVSRAAQMLGARHLKTMKIPVLFDRDTTSEILGFISDAFLGENIIKGKSALKDKLGKKCFSGCIKLSDNPLDARAGDNCPFDGEGVPSQDTILINDGVVVAFLYDTYWATLAGKKSTGSSVRGGYRSWPTLSTRHLCLEPGMMPISKQLEDLPLVLRVTDIMGMHTANPITGELSVGINGVLLERGGLAYPVREAALSGNIYEMFSRVVAVDNDPRGFGHVLCPSILLDSIDISSQ
jgi:PmbA protein